VALQIEGIVDGRMETEKALRRTRRFEPLHLAFSRRTVSYDKSKPRSARSSSTSR
jgi:hypothetical protein